LTTPYRSAPAANNWGYSASDSITHIAAVRAPHDSDAPGIDNPCRSPRIGRQPFLIRLRKSCPSSVQNRVKVSAEQAPRVVSKGGVRERLDKISLSRGLKRKGDLFVAQRHDWVNVHRTA
jgi:hypothetical protein